MPSFDEIVVLANEYFSWKNEYVITHTFDKNSQDEVKNIDANVIWNLTILSSSEPTIAYLRPGIECDPSENPYDEFLGWYVTAKKWDNEYLEIPISYQAYCPDCTDDANLEDPEYVSEECEICQGEEVFTVEFERLSEPVTASSIEEDLRA